MSRAHLIPYGIIRVAGISPKVYLTEPVKNAAVYIKEIRRASKRGVMDITFPELGITGYTCGNLFHDELLIAEARRVLMQIVDQTKQCNVMVTVGVPLKFQDNLYNCAVTFARGRILGIAPKKYLPNYREFYEMQYFRLASSADFDYVDIGIHKDIPFGTCILYSLTEDSPFIKHTSVCEDDWTTVPPGSIAALKGATYFANLSASNVTVGKGNYRRDMVAMHAASRLGVMIYVSAGEGENTTDSAWDSHCILAESTGIKVDGERFTQDGTSIIYDIDLGTSLSDRKQQNSFSDNAQVFETNDTVQRMCAHLILPTPKSKQGKALQTFRRTVSPTPFVPEDPVKLSEHCYEVLNIQATALAARMRELPQDMQKMVIGISGGLDSTLALLVCVRTVDILGLSRESIIGVTMPGFGTNKNVTYRNAIKLMQSVGCKIRDFDIRDAVTQRFVESGYDLSKDKSEHQLPLQNGQAWERTQHLLNITVAERAILVGTGDLSEAMLGWSTYLGDHASHYNPNASVPKTLVKAIVRWAATDVYGEDKKLCTCLIDICETEISPELKYYEGGQITHKTEDEIGPYILHDFYGYHITRFGRRPEVVYELAKHAFDGYFREEEIAQWLRIFYTRFLGSSQFKRDMVPGSPKIGQVCMSPRSSWRMPTNAMPTMWVEALDRYIKITQE